MRPLVLLLAVGLDLWRGEPRAGRHPVAWLGRLLLAAERRTRRRGTAGEGALALLTGVAAAAAAGAAVGAAARRLGPAGPVLEALALKPAFALRRLAEAAREVRDALAAADLPEARRRVGLHLVSRPVAELDALHVASAAVESVAENLTDSVAAPLLAYAVGGLPAAWAYRAANTADALWGYRDPPYARFGWPAARLDDLVNLVPARLAALTLVAGAALAGERACEAARVLRRDRGRTASPNAGCAMAAMAGALGVALEKPGAYRLGIGALPEGPGVIERALRVFGWAAALLVALALGAAAARAGSWRR